MGNLINTSSNYICSPFASVFFSYSVHGFLKSLHHGTFLKFIWYPRIKNQLVIAVSLPYELGIFRPKKWDNCFFVSIGKQRLSASSQPRSKDVGVPSNLRNVKVLVSVASDIISLHNSLSSVQADLLKNKQQQCKTKGGN